MDGNERMPRSHRDRRQPLQSNRRIDRDETATDIQN